MRSGRPWTRGARVLLVAFTLLITFVVLYGRALDAGLLSDAWVMLDLGRSDWQDVLHRGPQAHGYHTIPLADVLSAVQWRLFGPRQGHYQLVNLSWMLIVAGLLTAFGSALFGSLRIGCLAGLLFLANSSFYEVPFWPVIGTLQSLAATFVLLALLAAWCVPTAARPGRYAWLFALFVLGAFLTYEPGLSSLPAGLALVALSAVYRPPEDQRRPARVYSALLACAVPAALAFAVIAWVKLWAVGQGMTTVFLPDDLETARQRVYLAVRGTIAVFSLRGAEPTLAAIFGFGRPVGWLGGHKGHVIVWLLILGTAFVALVSPHRRWQIRWAALWFLMHLCMISVATNITSRHFYLAALPAALVSAALLWWAAEALARLVTGNGAPSRRWGPSAIVCLFLAVLVSGSAADLARADRIHERANAAARELSRLVTEEADSGRQIVAVNLPALLVDQGVNAFAFVNGVFLQIEMATSGRVRAERVRLRHTYSEGLAGRYASGSEEIGLPEFYDLVHRPGVAILAFDPRRQTVVALDAKGLPRPSALTAEAVPWLQWQPGAWSWLRLPVGKSLAVPLRSPDTVSWVALRYLRNPATSLAVRSGAETVAEVEPGAPGAPFWTVLTASLPQPTRDLDLVIEPRSEVWLAYAMVFSPPPSYSSSTAPFLPWTAHHTAVLMGSETTLLPIRIADCAVPCRVELELRAGATPKVEIDGQAIDVNKEATPLPDGWRALGWDLTSGASEVLVSITPAPEGVVELRRLERTPVTYNHPGMHQGGVRARRGPDGR